MFIRDIWGNTEKLGSFGIFPITCVGATLDVITKFFKSDTHGQLTPSSFFIPPAFDAPIHDCSVFLVTLSKEHCNLLRVYSVLKIVF
mgnify:FL=1